MAPRGRKALANINVNALKSKNEEQANEIDSLKEQLADLTSTLSKLSIGDKKPNVAPVVPPSMPSAASLVRVPHPPKRAVSAYAYFVKHARNEHASELAGVSMKDSSATVASWWKELNEEAKKPFNAQADADRARYEKEHAAFKAAKDAADRERKALEMHFHEQKVAAALALYEHQMAGGKPAEAPVPRPTKAKKVDDKPKGARSAYNLFVAHRRAELAAQCKDGEKPSITTKELADEWNAIGKSKAKKNKAIVAKFNKLALADKERASKEKAAYEDRKSEEAAAEAASLAATRDEAMLAYEKVEKEQALVKEAAIQSKLEAERLKEDRKKAREAKKAEKEAKALLPKKARSAYILFCAEMRPKVTQNAKLAPSEVLKELGAMWKSVSTKEKTKFEKLAAADKARYAKEMAALKK